MLAIALQITSQTAALLLGVIQWISPFAWLELIAHGFYSEVTYGFFAGILFLAGVTGFLKKGIYRYLTFCLVILLLVITGIVLIGFTIFSWIFLDGLIGPSTLFRLHYSQPDLWRSFITTETLITMAAMAGLILIAFDNPTI